jgi:hypothetical protein
MNEHDEHVEIYVALERDHDGYPPFDNEALWAVPLGRGTFRLDTIPYYAAGLADGDTVGAQELHGRLRFVEVIEASGASTLRAIVYAKPAREAREQLARELRSLGCETEDGDVDPLLAISVPAATPIEPVLQLLEAGERAERWTYDTGVISQAHGEQLGWTPT